VSAVEQMKPSSHGAVLLVWMQPVAGLHESSVQTLPSPQLVGGPPTQRPPLHTSPEVHAFPSLHGAVLLVCTHPVAGLHVSLVQPLLSLQLGGAPPTQPPPLQVSFVVQALPSLHGAVLLVWTHPVDGSHVSSVQPLLSLQLGAAPPTQPPPLHVSLVVQALPSSQGAVLFD
jgi:hypothetical protein